MKWVKKNEYYIESLSEVASFSISKSKVCGKVHYELWKLPYNNAEFIYRSKDLNDVKAQAIQYHKEQFASANDEAARLSRESARDKLAGNNQGALF